jgi:hypothetical protein
MSKGIRNALIIGGSIIFAAVILIVYMYLPLDGLQYFAGKYSTDKDTSYEDGNSIVNIDEEYTAECRIISVSISVSPGDEATVKAHGKPCTEYSIEVVYSSGPSTAAGLENKVSDKEGYIEWSWTVGSNVKPGIYKIKVKGESGEFATAIFEVTE